MQKKLSNENQQNWFYIACKEQGWHFENMLSKFQYDSKFSRYISFF